MESQNKNVENWTKKTLGELCKRVSVGHVGPTTVHFCSEETGVPLIRSMNVKPGELRVDGLAYITREFHNKLKKSQLKEGDILIVRVGANRGDCCTVPKGIKEINCANIVFARPKDKTGYLGFFFRSPIGQGILQSLSTGSAQGVINTSSIEKITIPIPPLPTQKKIAAILSAYDDLIENNNQRIRLLEEMAEEIYKEWFVRLRFPGYQEATFRDKDGKEVPHGTVGALPEGWELCKLKDKIELAYGKSLTAENREDGNIPVYGSGGIAGHHSKSLVEGPGLIVGRKGTVGSVFYEHSAFYPIDTVFYVITTLPLEYVYHNLQFQNFISGDAAVPGLNRNQAYSNRFLSPHKLILDEYSSLAKPIFEEINILQQKNQVLRETRDLLLPRLISGKLRVDDLEVEVETK